MKNISISFKEVINWDCLIGLEMFQKWPDIKWLQNEAMVFTHGMENYIIATSLEAA